MNWFDEILHGLFKGLCVHNSSADTNGTCASLQCNKCGVTIGLSYFEPDGNLRIHVCEGYKKYSEQITKILIKEENHPQFRVGFSEYERTE